MAPTLSGKPKPRADHQQAGVTGPDPARVESPQSLHLRCDFGVAGARRKQGDGDRPQALAGSHGLQVPACQAGLRAEGALGSLAMLAGALSWLWLGASALAACFRIDPTRSQAAVKELLGEDFGGIVISDPLRRLPLPRCPPTAAVLVSRHQAAGRALRGQGGDGALRGRAGVAAGRIRVLLEQGDRGHNRRERNLCGALLGEYEALWTFCEMPDVSPRTTPRRERSGTR
jgi:hypothetical protein